MIKANKIRTNIVVVCIIAYWMLSPQTAVAQHESDSAILVVHADDWVALIDSELSYWEVFTGVPEPSIVKLPPDYQKNENGKNVEPLGLGDPMNIFTVTQEDDEYVLNISGQMYAGLTSLQSYSNYHLTLLFKWGEKKYEPRIERKRDNGVLYHCHGPHGAFWNVWKSSLEFQIQEGDFGDSYTLAGAKADIYIDDQGRWSPTATVRNKSIKTKRSIDAENPHGEWSRIDLYVIDDSAVHVTNGKVVLALTKATSKTGEKLDNGQIQIQSEAAECYMKDVRIRSVKEYPQWIIDQIKP